MPACPPTPPPPPRWWGRRGEGGGTRAPHSVSTAGPGAAPCGQPWSVGPTPPAARPHSPLRRQRGRPRPGKASLRRRRGSVWEASGPPSGCGLWASGPQAPSGLGCTTDPTVTSFPQRLRGRPLEGPRGSRGGRKAQPADSRLLDGTGPRKHHPAGASAGSGPRAGAAWKVPAPLTGRRGLEAETRFGVTRPAGALRWLVCGFHLLPGSPDRTK